MVSRPVVLVFLLVVLIVTSQFEWKQQLVNELESTTRNHQHISRREELVKDKDRALQIGEDSGLACYSLHFSLFHSMLNLFYQNRSFLMWR